MMSTAAEHFMAGCLLVGTALVYLGWEVYKLRARVDKHNARLDAMQTSMA